MKTVIIGGVAGGATAAARLRRLDEHAEIVMLERGEFISFANCGLPYYIGGAIKRRAALTLQTPESFHARYRVEVCTLSEAVAIDPEAKTVTVKNLQSGKTYAESYDTLILSPGALPILPPIEGATADRVFTLRNLYDTFAIKEYADKLLQTKPQSKAVVVGGGYVGVEIAENLKEAGFDVTVVELADHLIGPIDFDMAADVHKYIADKGINLMLQSGVDKILETDADSPITVILKGDIGELSADLVILAVGVAPDTAFAVKSGIAANARGTILVDAHMRTNLEDIYAVGDAVEVQEFVTKTPAFVPLAGPANKQGRIAADNIHGLDSAYRGTQGSAILKLFDMTIASTGINEKTAQRLGVNYDKVYLYSASHATYYPGATNMSIKVLFEKGTGKILGAQIVGFDGVDKRCDVFATAIRLGATAKDLTELELSYAPPFGSAKDPVNMAGYVIENVMTGKVKQFFWHDVASLPRDGSVTLLDVRTDFEVSNGRIDGFMHITLDELRENVDKLDNTKPIYIHCHSGLRSYIACRLLSGYGFDCYNLAGGWRLYQVIAGQKTFWVSGAAEEAQRR